LFYAIAASAVILLGIFWVFNPSNSNEKLYNDYFSVDPGLPTTMGSNDGYSFYDGMVNYKRKEYDEALEKWKLLLPQKNDNDTLNYFIGVTYLAKGNTEEAIPFLEKVTAQMESMFLEDSYFYLGLSNLKNDNKEKAIDYFKKSNHPEAQKILKVLEEK
jgi:tetratricopeptide (TPR) repeat protein